MGFKRSESSPPEEVVSYGFGPPTVLFFMVKFALILIIVNAFFVVIDVFSNE